MPFTGDSFAHLFDWEKDPQRQEKIVNARLEAEFDGVDTGLSAVAARTTVLEAVTHRDVLTANRTYYFRSDGSDSNTGLVDSAGGAFLTIQKAVDTVAALDLSIYDVTIQCTQTGVTFTGNTNFKTLVGAGKVIILGDETTPSNVTVSISSGGHAMGDTDGLSQWRGVYQVRGIKFTTSGGSRTCLQANGPGGIIQMKNCEFGAASAHHMLATQGGLIQYLDNYLISGAPSWHQVIAYGGMIHQSKGSSMTVTISGSPAWVGGFALATVGGMMRTPSITYSGAATGKRYHSDGNAAIHTGGGGANYFPGNVAGTTTADGEYA